MSFSITEAFVNQYSANFLTLAQQKESRLESCVMVESGIVGASKAVERIGATDAYALQSRHTDTLYVDTPHSRRWLDLFDFAWADLVDEMDKIKMLIDPTSPYLQAGVMALNRKKDDVIIAAFNAAARTGTGTQAANSAIADGSAGLTVAKLITAKQNLDEAEVGDDEPRFLVCTSEQISNLLSISSGIIPSSGDYNTIKALVAGEIDTYLGFKFIRSERLPKASTIRTCFAFAKNGVTLGIGKDITTSIDILPTKNQSVQVYARMSLGAVRMEEARVVGIDCVETA
jgi:hypothetical protein